jgi:hypothetical protein
MRKKSFGNALFPYVTQILEAALVVPMVLRAPQAVSRGLLKE